MLPLVGLLSRYRSLSGAVHNRCQPSAWIGPIGHKIPIVIDGPPERQNWISPAGIGRTVHFVAVCPTGGLTH